MIQEHKGNLLWLSVKLYTVKLLCFIDKEKL